MEDDARSPTCRELTNGDESSRSVTNRHQSGDPLRIGYNGQPSLTNQNSKNKGLWMNWVKSPDISLWKGETGIDNILCEQHIYHIKIIINKNQAEDCTCGMTMKAKDHDTICTCYLKTLILQQHWSEAQKVWHYEQLYHRLSDNLGCHKVLIHNSLDIYTHGKHVSFLMYCINYKQFHLSHQEPMKHIQP